MRRAAVLATVLAWVAVVVAVTVLVWWGIAVAWDLPIDVEP